MSFLDENGLTYFYGKLKEKFIRTVNSEAPDANGNVTITNVATADNLTSPDAQASYGTFIYRTSGGSASLSSGEAQLVYIDGNIDIVGRVAENFQITATNNITTTYLADVWRSQIDEDGTYVFTYIQPTSSAAAASWTTSGTWSYDGSQISMSSFGLYPSNVIDPSISAVVSGSGITAATVVPSTFFSQITTDNVITFQYVNYEDEQQQQHVGWQLNDEIITLNTYGITVTGTAVDGDTITITSIVGTPNSTLTVIYTAPQQGTINVATPTVFSATGFNQFDKNSMVLANASFSSGKIIQNTGTYACYCHAKGGVDNGYVAYSESGAILDIGWCANIPTIGADVITTRQSVSDSLASIPFDDDGYVVVIASSTADICIHPKWSGSADTEYAAYVAPSTITIPTQDINNNDLPTATYGIPKIGAIADRINLDAGTYIQKIGRLENNSSNMSYVVSIDVAYDYDDNYIYYVLPNTITYNIDVDPIYTVNDWGTEEFLGTTVPLSAQLLYGQNLRDKLRTDVLTISTQTPPLTSRQREQVLKNIGIVNVQNPNLLDNWYFDGGGSQLGDGTFPINTRGKTTYSGSTYTIDRWRTWDGDSTLTLHNGYITLSVGANGDGLFQYMGNRWQFHNKIITVSAIINGELFSATGTATSTAWIARNIDSDGSYLAFVLTETEANVRIVLKANKSANIRAVKLEFGSTQTLAHEESGSWILINEIPNYEEQLIRCKTSPVYAYNDYYTGNVISYNAPNPNLLDNWYFVGGGSQQGGGQFPINQRGQASYSIPASRVYTIDRWASYDSGASGTVQVASGGVTLTRSSNDGMYLIQTLERSLVGSTVTLSVLTSDGTLRVGSATVSSIGDTEIIGAYPYIRGATWVESGKSLLSVYVYAASLTISAIKLEFGTTQTLAHQENGAWVLNEIPNYQQELAKCQRYFIRFNGDVQYKILALGFGFSATQGRFMIPLPVTPNAGTLNLTMSGTWYITPADNSTTNYTVTSIGRQAGWENGFCLNANVSSGLTAGKLYYLRVGAAGASISYSMDL